MTEHSRLHRYPDRSNPCLERRRRRPVELKAQCAQVTRRRRKLQLAIDAEYSPGTANAAFRKQFGLQGNKAMS